MKNKIIFAMIFFILFNTLSVAASEMNTDTNNNEVLKYIPIIDHDINKQITTVGNSRISKIPMVLPVSGQTFKKAVVMRAPISNNLSPTGVAMRLDSSYVNKSISANDIISFSIWMKVGEGTGKAFPYLETQNNTARLDFEMTELTDKWKKYVFVAKALNDMPTVKTTINIGYSGQVSYFADLHIDNYGSDVDIEDVKKTVIQDFDKDSDDEGSEIKMQSALQNTIALTVDSPDAFVNGNCERIDNESVEIMPYTNSEFLYVPLRYIASHYCTSIDYKEIDRSVTILQNNTQIDIYQDSNMWQVNGKRWRANSEIQNKNGTMYISGEILAELLDLKTYYDSEKKVMLISDASDKIDYLKQSKYTAEVYDKIVLTPQEYFNIKLIHEDIKNEIGIPAIISPSSTVPQIEINAQFDGTVSYDIFRNDESISANNTLSIQPDKSSVIDISEQIGILDTGEYKIDFTITSGEKNYYDSIYFFVQNASELKRDDCKILYCSSDGKLVYVPDYKGNTIPDYSGTGYKNGKEPIPDVPAVIEVTPSGQDDTENIQNAIDYVSGLPQMKNGLRGAVQLSKGVYKVSGMLKISIDGVVLRGAGNDNPNIVNAVPTGDAEEFARKNKDTDGTIILLTTTVPETRMMDIVGQSTAIAVPGTEEEIVDNYVPTGRRSFRIENAQDYAVGDEIIIDQTGNMAWVHEIGMDQIPARTVVDANSKNNEDSATVQWKEHNWKYERVITNIDGNTITVDLPIVNAIAKRWGGAKIYKYTDTGRVQNVGIENMRVIAAWTPNADNVDTTYHAGELVTIKNAKDVWLRDITTEHLNLYNVNISNSVKRVTVQDFYDLVAPISYYSGKGYESTGRTFLETQVYVGRYGVYMGGQQVLVQRFYGTNLRHLVEYMGDVAGPNVAYNCKSIDYFNQMGPHMLWSTGGLYDNVDGALHIENRLSMGSGHGWAGAWFTAWNTTDRLAVQKPPTAQNWAIGHVGDFSSGDYPQFEQGYWELDGTPSNIKSLFSAQTEERYGQTGTEILNNPPLYDYSIHKVPEDLYANYIEINNERLVGYQNNQYNYTYITDYGTTETPVVTAYSENYDIVTEQAQTPDGSAKITVTDGTYSQIYIINFVCSKNPFIKIRSSADDGNIAENIFDKNTETRWSSSGKNQWVSFEFKTPIDLAKIAMAFYKGNERATYFDIEESDDGVSYTSIYSGQSTGNSDTFESYTFKPLQTKYLRIYCNGNTVNAWNSITEIKFFDSKGTELFADD